jgi:hypothetical protein
MSVILEIRMTRNIRLAYALVLGLSFLPVQGWPAFAADNPQPSQGADQNTDQNKEGPNHHWCKDDPEKCKERREEWCKNNAEKCEAHKKRHEEWCKSHPDKCTPGDSSSKPSKSDKPSDSSTPSQ